MKCPSCGAQNRHGARFCEICGISLTTTCAACNAEVGPDRRFCGACGAALPFRTRQGQAAAPAAAAGMLTSRGVFEGERKQVTVLFADMRGSLELLADRDPEEARSLLDPVLECMIQAVHR